jgi:hypothetical protein
MLIAPVGGGIGGALEKKTMDGLMLILLSLRYRFWLEKGEFFFLLQKGAKRSSYHV